jgi:hypothetical protein
VRYVRAFLDNSLEVAIALLRAVAFAGGLALPVLSIGLIWSESGQRDEWLGTLVLVALFALGAGFAGFYTFGNEEWRRGKADDRGAEVRHD